MAKSGLFSPSLCDALNVVSQDVAADMHHDATAEEVAELCMDQLQFKIRSYEAEYLELKACMEDYGYEAAIEEAAKHVSTW